MNKNNTGFQRLSFKLKECCQKKFLKDGMAKIRCHVNQISLYFNLPWLFASDNFD